MPQPSLLDSLPQLDRSDDFCRMLNGMLAEARRAATRVERLLEVERKLDQLWRQGEQNRPAIAPLYARLLGLRSGSGAPLDLTHALAKHSRDPVSHCLHARNLVLNDRSAWAQTYVKEILSQYLVDADPELPPLLDELAEALGAAGWLGMSRGGLVRGRLGPLFGQKKKGRISAQGAIFKHCEINDGCFEIELTEQQSADSLRDASVSGRPLLTHQIPQSQINAIDGRVWYEQNRLQGWVSSLRAPGIKPRLNLRTSSGGQSSSTALVRSSYSRWTFDFELSTKMTSALAVEVRAAIEGLGQFTLPDSPAVLGIEPVRASRRLYRRGGAGSPAGSGTIIIPVYNNLADAARCIETARQCLPISWSIVVIDDASTDPAASTLLGRLAGPAVRVVTLPENGGYARAVNAGISQCAGDVILLNSDAIIFPGTVEKMQRAVYASADIATVTAPSSDDSVAGINFKKQDEARAIHTASLIHQTLFGHENADLIEMPTGVGHCMYVKRACLDDVGLLDHALFPAGYGEETDFCFRASARGWKHVIATGLFCFHSGGKSFSHRRLALLDRGDRVMAQKYPGYRKAVGLAVRSAELARFKRRLQQQLLRLSSEKFVLIVAPRLWGGVNRVVVEQCERFRDAGLCPLILHPGNDLARGELHLWHRDFEPSYLSYRIADELEELTDLLNWLHLESIHIHHFVGMPFALLQQLTDRYQMSSHLYLHDYSWACPRINLLDSASQFCGQPTLKDCRRCIDTLGSLLYEDIAVAALRVRSKTFIDQMAHVYVMSDDASKRLSRMLNMPDDRFITYELEKPLSPAALKPVRESGPLKVVVMGAIGFHKGYKILQECAKDARRRQLPITFTVIGYTHDNKKLLGYNNITITGHYSEQEAAFLLERENADVFFCSSIVPETWCFTLTYPLKLGLPVFSFDLGAQAERLKNYAATHLIPRDIQARTLNDLFLKSRKPIPSSVLADPS